MSMLLHNVALAAAAEEDSGGSFLVSPNLGVMVWTLVVFGICWFILAKFAFPKIAEALDKRQAVITESLEAAERHQVEAEKLAAENREQLLAARSHAEEILVRARKSAEAHEVESRNKAKVQAEEILDQAKSDIAAETRRAISEIRSEVADLTILATTKVTGKTLDGDDQRRLVEEALDGLDFSALSGDRRR